MTERAPLSQTRISAAALRLIDEQGLQRLTMQELGESLGVEGMSLYRHFPSKAAILDAVLEELLASIPVPESGRDWRGALTRLCDELWALFLAHPNILPLVVSRPPGSPSGTRLAAAIIALLRKAGFEERAARRLNETLVAYLVGYAWVITSGWALHEAQAAPALEVNLHPSPQADDAVSRDLASAERRQDFDAGLAIVLEGAARVLGVG